MRTLAIAVSVLFLAAPAAGATFEGKLKGVQHCQSFGAFKLKGEFSMVELSGARVRVSAITEDGTLVAVLTYSHDAPNKKGLTRYYHDAFVDLRGLLATAILHIEFSGGNKKIKGTFIESNYFFDDCSTQVSYKGKRR